MVVAVVRATVSFVGAIVEVVEVEAVLVDPEQDAIPKINVNARMRRMTWLLRVAVEIENFPVTVFLDQVDCDLVRFTVSSLNFINDC